MELEIVMYDVNVLALSIKPFEGVEEMFLEYRIEQRPLYISGLKAGVIFNMRSTIFGVFEYTAEVKFEINPVKYLGFQNYLDLISSAESSYLKLYHEEIGSKLPNFPFSLYPIDPSLHYQQLARFLLE